MQLDIVPLKVMLPEVKPSFQFVPIFAKSKAGLWNPINIKGATSYPRNWLRKDQPKNGAANIKDKDFNCLTHE